MSTSIYALKDLKSGHTSHLAEQPHLILPRQGMKGAQPPLPVQAEQWLNVWLQSPTTQQRLHQRVQAQMTYEVGSWSVTEVCDWVEEIGLGQYRRRFLHHCIDGNLLLRLTGHELKVGLSIDIIEFPYLQVSLQSLLCHEAL